MNKKKAVFGFIVFAPAYLVYILTCAPGVQFTDSGELAGVCTTLGVSHPSGYPLFAILGRLWILLPIPVSNIYKLNLFAGFSTAVSAFMLFNILYLLFSNFYKPTGAADRKTKNNDNVTDKQKFSETKIAMSAASGALTYAFAGVVWAQATSIEVYSLHLTMITSVIFCALKYYFAESKKFQWGAAASLLLGLSFANHLTTVLLLPGLLFLLFKKRNDGFDFSSSKLKELALFLIPLFIGLSLYAYMPLRSSAQPMFNWGYVSRGFDKFLYHLQGKQYQIWMFSGSKVMIENFGKFLSAFPYQMWALFFVPIFSSFAYYKNSESKIGQTLNAIFNSAFPFTAFSKYNKDLLYFLLILIVSCLVYSLNYSIHDIESYFLLAYMAFIILYSVSILYLPLDGSKTAITLIIPVFSLFLNYTENDVSKDYTVDEYTKIVCDNLEPNALIISSQWDYWVSAFGYKQKIEGYRTDVSLFEKELARRTWYKYQFAKWEPELSKACEKNYDAFMVDLENFESGKPYEPANIQGNYLNLVNGMIDYAFSKGRPVYVTLEVIETEAGIGAGYEKVPQGFAFRLYKDSGIKKFDVNKLKLDKFIASISGRKDELYIGAQRSAFMNLFNNARYSAMTNQFDEARKALKLAMRIDDKDASAYELLSQIDEAQKRYNASVQGN